MRVKRISRIALVSFIIVASLALAALYLAPHLLMWYAERAFAAKNFAGTEKALRLLVAMEPNHRQAHFLYAKDLRQMQRYPEADAQLGKAAELGLSKEEGLREFGLLWAGFNFSQAKGALQRVLDEHPDDVEVLQALVHGCMSEASTPEAEMYLTRWVEVRPSDIEPLLGRGQLYLDTRQFKKAAADFRAVLLLNPQNYRAHLWLGLALLSDARIAEAEPELRLCRQMRPDSAEPLISLAECAMEKGDFVNAYTLLYDALALDPGSLLALKDLGDLHLSQKRYEDAVKTFGSIVKSKPNDKLAHLKLVQAFNGLGQQDKAREHERRYQELDALEMEQSKNQRHR